MYEEVIPAGVYKASSIEVAEAAKVIENIQRDLNIALMNELALIMHKLDIDTHEVLEAAARSHEPHQLAHYSRELANDLHSYYNAHQFITDEETVRDARMCLILATKQVLVNVLTILGVSAPESM